MPLSPIELIYGPTLVGIFLNLLLYGISGTQVYFYITTFKRDKLMIKILVGFIFLADSLNTTFDALFLYKRLVHSFGDEEALMVADWVFSTDPAMTCIIASAVQLFFAWRIKVLTQNSWMYGVIALCSAVQFVAGLATAVACSIVTQFVEFQKFKVVVILWLAFSALADVIIAVASTRNLQKRKTGFAFTDDLINRITRLTIQTGVVTAIFAIADLVTFLVTTSGLHLAFNMPLAKLYTNSLLSSLNSRLAPGSSLLEPFEGQYELPQMGAREGTIRVGLHSLTSTRPHGFVNLHPGRSDHGVEITSVHAKIPV